VDNYYNEILGGGMKIKCLGMVATSLLLTIVSSSPVLADARVAGEATQSQSDTGLDEIIVQARRRDEKLIDVPVAITVLSGTEMDNAGIQNILGVSQYTPGLVVAEGVNDSTVRFFVRGIGTATPTLGVEPSVPIYIDDIYTPSGVASNINVFAFDRVEVLRGPQGTLYGRNSYGGAIKFYTKPFSDVPEGYVTVGIGNKNGRDLKAEFAAPVIPGKLWIGGGAASFTRDGYQTDPYTGVAGWAEDTKIVKAKIQFDPIDNLRFTVAYDDTRSDAPDKEPKIANIGNYVFNTGSLAGYPGIVPNLGQSSTDPDTIDTSARANEKVFAHGTTWSATWHVSDNFSLKYLGSDRQIDNVRVTDITGTASPFLIVNEEFRFAGKTNELQANWSSQKLNIVGGLFQYKEDQSGLNEGPNGFLSFLDPNHLASVVLDAQGRPTMVNLQSLTVVQSQQVTSKAAFVNATYNFTDHWNASAGLRYTHDDKAAQGNRPGTVFYGGSLAEFETNPCFCIPPGATILTTTYGGQPSGERTFSATTPEFTLDYKPSATQLLYASFKRGFQAGTFFPGYQLVPGAALSTNAQTVDAFELGSKGIYFDDVININVAVYYNRFHNLIVSVNTPVPIEVSATGFAGVPNNAGAANSKGVEIESQYKPYKGLTFTGNIAYTDFNVTQVLTDVNGVATNVADTFLRPYTLAPKIQGNVGAQYDLPAGGGNTVNLFVNAAFRSAMGINSANAAESSGIGLVASNPLSDPYYISKGMTNVSAGVAFTSADKNWRVDLTGHNLLNERRPVASISVVPNFLGAIQQWNEPINWKLYLTRRF
jgi:iron complex outermembrane recepter protein